MEFEQHYQMYIEQTNFELGKLLNLKWFWNLKELKIYNTFIAVGIASETDNEWIVRHYVFKDSTN